ncbi:RTA1 like protein-domain-containing protein [Diaporthe sp. PMI_573]|nr:RTA1 like protein-domain-containing protein [Diaporthaceae sp. PMI_573]
MSNSTSDATTGYSFYHYDANPEAVLGVVAGFGFSAVVHLIMMIWKRTFFYTPMTVGAFMMTGGYGFRYLSLKSPDNLTLYIAQNLLILLPPSLYAATMYMIYGRIVLFVNSPDASIIRPTRVTKVFVIGDVLSFFIQSAGGGMMAQQGTADLGQKVLLTGLGIQIVFFGFFLIIAITFNNRMSRSPTRHIIPVYGKHSWRKLLQLLLVASVFIVIRCGYRVAEYVMGNDGYLMDNEWCAYVGDTIPMLFVQVAFHFVHAGDVFPKAGEERIEDKSYFSLEERV